MESEPLYKLKAEFFKTLGHPARIRVLELLAVRDRSVAELLPEVGLVVVELVAAVGGAAPRGCGGRPQGREHGDLFDRVFGHCGIVDGGAQSFDQGAQRPRRGARGPASG